MFESLRERREAQKRSWGRMVAIGSAIFIAAILIVRWQIRASAEREYEEYRAAYKRNPVFHDEQREYRRVALPGMSIEVPGTGTLTGARERGAFGGSYPVEFALTWATGTLPTGEAREALVARLAASIQQEAQLPAPPHELSRTEVRFGDHAGYRVAYSSYAMMVIVTLGECDGRLLILVAAGSDIDATNERMTRSFQCG